jgi:2,3-bisphosphoglycerate-dependent phosphoglycerate mutase
MELYFIRHGQSVNNVNWKTPGYLEHPDAPLTEVGLEQAQYLAEFLGQNQPIRNASAWNAQNCFGFGLTQLYTSLVERAVRTAAPVAQALGISFSAWPEIHEVGGIYSREDHLNRIGLPGKPRSYFEQNFPALKLPDELDESGWWNRPYETDEQRQPRANQFLADLLARHGDREGQPEERVAIVSHGDFFVYLMCSLLNLTYRKAAHNSEFWFYLNNCSISRFDIHPGEILIAYLNRTDHLPANLITD